MSSSAAPLRRRRSPGLGQRLLVRGLTLIELMMSIAVLVVLAAVATPPLQEFLVNSRLREGGSSLMAEALYAQSEAIKRNGNVRLTVNGNELRVLDRSTGADVVLRERSLGESLSVDAAATLDFGSTGGLLPRGAVVDNIGLSRSGSTCGSDIRCPALRVESGGGIRLCPNKSSCS
jgi:type IV fimbrial biogenesis protein FimT